MRDGSRDGGSRASVLLTTFMCACFPRTRSKSIESLDCRAWTSITESELVDVGVLTSYFTSDGKESGAEVVCFLVEINGFSISLYACDLDNWD
jgi:hypothetical protein